MARGANAPTYGQGLPEGANGRRGIRRLEEERGSEVIDRILGALAEKRMRLRFAAHKRRLSKGEQWLLRTLNWFFRKLSPPMRIEEKVRKAVGTLSSNRKCTKGQSQEGVHMIEKRHQNFLFQVCEDMREAGLDKKFVNDVFWLGLHDYDVALAAFAWKISFEDPDEQAGCLKDLEVAVRVDRLRRGIRPCPECDGEMRFHSRTDVVEHKGRVRELLLEAWWCTVCDEAIFEGEALLKRDEVLKELTAEAQKLGLGY